jgi:DNA-binding GntR family transcriptional regulator
MNLRLVKLDSTPDLVDRVYHALVDAISAGVLKPGERVTQEDLADRFAVSRQPVLQAFRLLKNEGLLQDAPGRGVLITPLDVGAIAQVYQIRGALDSLAARLAAQNRHRIDPRVLAAGRKAVRSRDVTAMIEADAAFHASIYAGSGNPLIEPSARLHWCHVRRAMGAVLQTAKLRASVWDEHQAIADAIAAGLPDEAERLMRRHTQHASEEIGQHLSAALSAPPPKRRQAAKARPAVRKAVKKVAKKVLKPVVREKVRRSR